MAKGDTVVGRIHLSGSLHEKLGTAGIKLAAETALDIMVHRAAHLKALEAVAEAARDATSAHEQQTDYVLFANAYDRMKAAITALDALSEPPGDPAALVNVLKEPE